MAFTARIIKGGALLEDSRRFVEAWDPALDAEANLERILDENLLAKPTRNRTTDVLAILRRRFLRCGPEVVEALRSLAPTPRPFRDACFYEAARDDELLAGFTGQALFGWRRDDRRQVDPTDVDAWLVGQGPAWSPPTRKRVAEGLLAAARDFGLLDGVVHKRIQPPALSLTGFAYAALRERTARVSSRALMDSPVWRRYLLDDHDVRALFHEADRHKILRLSEAGSMARIDWLIDDLREVAGAPLD
ncbi:DUF1819 family protein [soil metagenome]